MTRHTLIASSIIAVLTSSMSALVCAETGLSAYQYSSKAIYTMPQAAQGYESAPKDYQVVYSQLVERHGARALSSPKYDILSKQVWDLANQRGQLTELGKQLGPVIEQVSAANQQLGYGLLTKIGEEEPAGIASRMAQRLRSMMANDTNNPVCIQVQTSGKERANQTAHYFMQALAKEVAYVDNNAEQCYQTQTQPEKIAKAMVNPYELYFHKQDPAKSADYQQYADNFAAYKKFQDSDQLEDTLDALADLPQTKQLSRQMLERIYTKPFVDFLANEVSRDKKCDLSQENCIKTNTRKPEDKEDDWKYVQSEVDAASMLYNLFIIGPGMLREAQAQGAVWNLEQFITPEESAWFSYLSDAEDFYEKGPSFANRQGVTYNIAKPLLKDMFNQVEAVANGQQAYPHVAKLRFAHAEQIMPLAALLKVEGSTQQANPNILYSQKNNEWRGGWVTPYSANIQWDVYKNSANGSETLVKMFYNEKEIAFKTGCAVYPGTQYFYSLTELKRCYSEELSINNKS